jgi:hypothetical protein
MMKTIQGNQYSTKRKYSGGKCEAAMKEVKLKSMKCNPRKDWRIVDLIQAALEVQRSQAMDSHEKLNRRSGIGTAEAKLKSGHFQRRHGRTQKELS